MRCGCPEHVLRDFAGAQSQWPQSCMRLNYYAVTSGLNGMTMAQFDEQIKRSLENCTEVSGLDIRRVDSISAAQVEMRPEPMRGGGILAYAYLPNNTCGGRLAVRFNSNVTWNPNLFIDTHTHELGHTFGLSHTNDVRDVMYPSMGRDYNGQFSDYYSIPQLRSRYGPEVDDDGGGDGGNGDDDMDFPDIPWMGLIRVLIEFFLEECLDQSDAVLVERIRNPRPMDKFRMARQTRLKMGLNRREWRQKGDEIMQKVYAQVETASDKELLDIIAEARDE